MVKFSKQFEGQLVPEWKEAFVDYCLLKKAVKKIDNQSFKNKKQKVSFSDAIISSLRKHTFLEKKHREPRVIHVLVHPSLSLSELAV